MNKFLFSVNPYSQQVIGEFPMLEAAALQGVLASADETYRRWRTESVTARIHYLAPIREGLTRNRREYAELISREMGKPVVQALMEVDKCALLCDFYTGAAERFLTPRTETYKEKKVHHLLAPTGLVLGIMPWNYPFWQVFRYALPTILGGNIALLKHAPNCTGSALALQELFTTGSYRLLSALPIDVSAVESVIAHPAVQGVCLTGSVQTGRIVGALAGKHLKKSVLELGSADALVVLPDADFHKALDAAFSSRTLNAGQACIAAKRVFVPHQKMKEAVGYFENKVKDIQLGDPLAESTYMGPLAKKEFVDVLAGQVNEAVRLGAKRVVGADASGAFFLPGILISEAQNPMNKEELFGPVLNVIGYDDEADLLTAINNTPFGLAASVWSADETRALQWASSIEAGSVAVNDFMKSDPRIPFGGIKNSGFGRELGELGLRTFLNEKAVIQTV